MMYMTTRSGYWSVYDLTSNLHIRVGHGGVDVFIKERKRSADNFKNSDDYTKMDEVTEKKFLSWLFYTIFLEIEEIFFEKDL